MSRSIRSVYPPKTVITVPEEKIIYVIGEGFIIGTVEDNDALLQAP